MDHVTDTTCIYTIGHSNRSIEDFLTLILSFGIETLADVRSRPGSRAFPHFDRDRLAQSLQDKGIAYHWMEELGGLRRRIKGFDSPNGGLTSPAFRAYADYMSSEAFLDASGKLLSLAERSTLAIMCAEALYWRCHRRLLSDYLAANHVEVIHIIEKGKSSHHTMTPQARVVTGGIVIYPGSDE